MLASLERGGSIAVTVYPAERNVARATTVNVPLHLIVAELHDARRHVAQIQLAFAASSCEAFLSLQDEAVASHAGAMVTALARRAAGADGELSARASRWLGKLVQRRAERAYTMMRLDVMSRDRQQSDLLAFSGQRE